MKNFGTANVQASLLLTLPGIQQKSSTYNFDVSAHMWPYLQQSAYFPPLLTENVTNSMGTFSACFPAKRIQYFHNYIAPKTKKAVSKLGQLEFFPTVDRDGYVKERVKKGVEDGSLLEYTLDPEEPWSTTYNGPKWKTEEISREGNPNDEETIEEWEKFIDEASTETETSTTTTSLVDADELIERETIPNVRHIVQTVTKEGGPDSKALWWAIRSASFLKENMPIWITLDKFSEGANEKQSSTIVISLGIDDPENEDRYDLILSSGTRPRLIDYSDPSGLGPTPSPPNMDIQFGNELSKVWPEDSILRIGIMTIAGRLVIYVKDVVFVYDRIVTREGDEAQTLRLAKIHKGRIRISGFNVKGRINVSPMTFAPISVIALPISTLPPSPGVSIEGLEAVEEFYQGVKNDGTVEGPVCILPQQPDKPGELYGVDCREYEGEAGTANPTGFGFHKYGTIRFLRASTAGIASLPESDYYILIMKPEDLTYPTGGKVINGLTPYFFRLKGGARFEVTPTAGTPIETADVISITETASAADYFHIKTNASVTLYNKGGKYDYLKETQAGITIYWGWGEDTPPTKTFTGVIINASSSEIAGKETIELHCEDYMYILKNTPIINSPYYDGMIGYYVIKDLAERAGIQEFIKDWEDDEEYFMPSGYAFTKPAVKFPNDNMIFDCMIETVKRFEAYIYFDAFGKLHIDKLFGGIFSEPGDFAATFTRDPSIVDNVILDEKRVEYDFDSTSNRISILSIERDTRNAIVHTRSASGAENNIRFLKVHLVDQAALGDIKTVRAWTEDLAKRVFYPIRKTSFKTVGNNSIVPPLRNILVENQEYRLMSVQRSYNADSNDFVNTYNAEWLAGGL